MFDCSEFLQFARMLRRAAQFFILLAVGVFSVSAVSKAETIAEFTAGTVPGASQIFWGHSVTTSSSGGPWQNIQFNFYDSSNNPFATGNLYLLSQPYTQAPGSLSSSTAGYIATGVASGGVWTFDSSLTLQPNTQYYFYMDTSIGTSKLLGMNPGSYPGGNAYASTGSANAYVDDPSIDVDFTLANPGPLPGAGLLSYLVLGIGGAAAFRKRLRERVASVLARATWRSPFAVPERAS